MKTGYVEVVTQPACTLFPPGCTVRGHVYHYSEILQEHVVGGFSQVPVKLSCHADSIRSPGLGWIIETDLLFCHACSWHIDDAKIVWIELVQDRLSVDLCSSAGTGKQLLGK